MRFKGNFLIILFLFLTLNEWVEADNEDDVSLEGEAILDQKPGLNSNGETLSTDPKLESFSSVDDLSASDMKELREKAEKFAFQTEVNRMMKLIINSLYRNKEIFLRELISNASDALDKIRMLSLTDRSILEEFPDLLIRIKADKDHKMLSITDTGIGMTKEELINNLGTIAKSGTAEFLSKVQDASAQEMNDMIGQFGVGFYSAFLVADTVTVTSKNDKDTQYIWESDSSNYSVVEDPRGETLKRGTTVSLHMKDEAADFLEQDTIKNLVKKYSQFINFPIYLWSKKTIEVDAKSEDADETEEEDMKVDDATEEKKTDEKIKKTVWDWEVLNDSKPIWTLKPSEITDEEYNNFYKTLTTDTKEPLAKVHFIAEGEVSFKSLLFIPEIQPSDSFNKYGTKTDNIKLYVRRVFISDKFNDLMPSYLAFVQGLVDSDDLPLNISRENLQQHKLIKIIKKKLVRKVLDMIKKIPKEDYEKFWKEYSTNIKLGIIEDAQNRARLSKLLLFKSSQKDFTSLSEYVSRMKPDQTHIYYIAGSSVKEVENSPFVEQLFKKGYEVLYLVEAVDEYALSSIPEFDGKKFQNVAKEDFSLGKEQDESDKKELETKFEPLLKWLNNYLKDYISRVELSDRLTDTSCVLVASTFGWTGNMERLAVSNAHQKTDDPQRTYYLNQKKVLEINPNHPIINNLLNRIEANKEDVESKRIAKMMFYLATLRSGYMLRDSTTFAGDVERLIKKDLNIPVDDIEEVNEKDTENSEEMESDHTEL